MLEISINGKTGDCCIGLAGTPNEIAAEVCVAISKIAESIKRQGGEEAELAVRAKLLLAMTYDGFWPNEGTHKEEEK